MAAVVAIVVAAGSCGPVECERILENARLTHELNTWKAQAQVHSEARKSAEGRIKQLEMDLDAAQKRGEKLEQKNIELSSRALLLREKTERSSRLRFHFSIDRFRV